MKKVDASRPGLGLPARLGILGLVLSGGVFASIAVMAKQNGTDVGSYITTFDFGKAYSRENLNYVAAEAKLKLGDRKGCAALVKTLTFDKQEGNLNYQELRMALIRAQLAAGEFTDARASAQDDRGLLVEVFHAQTEKQGLDAMLANAARVSEPDRSTSLATMTTGWLGYGGMATVQKAPAAEQLALSERLLPHLTPQAREGVFTTLMSAYYKAGNLPAALEAAARPQQPERRKQALNQLGSLCLQDKDSTSLKKVLEQLPKEPSQRRQVTVGNTKTTTTFLVPSPRQQLIEQATYQLPPAATLELLRTYSDPAELPSLLRTTCSQARSKKDMATFKASLALLRTQNSKEGREIYDQEAMQLFYDAEFTRSNGDLLALAQTIHSDRMRGQALQHLGRVYVQQENWQGVDNVLALLKQLPTPDAPLLRDSLIATALYPLQQSDPERAKKLAAQAMTPEMRQQYQLLLTQPHVAHVRSASGVGRVMLTRPTGIRR